MCGLEVTVVEGRVTHIRGDERDVWSRGFICPKGAVLGELQHDPDRLRHPLVRRGDRFVEVSWEDAYAEVARHLQPILRSDGIAAVTSYIGNPTAHNHSLSRYVPAFIPMSGIPRVYSAGTVDQWPKNVVGALMYGGMWSIPVPDIDRTDYLVIMGANPAASQGSLLACADVMGRIRAIRQRGGSVVVIDPRRTATAERADEWLAIRPGTDAAFLLAVVHVLFEEGLVQPGRLAGLIDGIDEVRRLSRDFSPEAVTGRCAVPAGTIRRIARDLARAPRAAVYGRIGTCTQEFGTLASWLVEVVNILTGNLDREGGAMFSNPIAWSVLTLRPPEFADGFEFDRYRSRVRGAPEVLGQFPVSCLAEDIATPGPGRIRGLITIAGNPVLSAPDASRLDAALPMLDCLVSVDNWLNETTRHAHVILPGCGVLEQPHYDEIIWSWAVRNGGKYSPPVFDPDPARPAEWEILLTLAGLTQGQQPDEIDVGMLDDLFFGGLVEMVAADPRSRVAGRNAADIVAATAGRGPDRILDFTIRTGPWGDGYGALPDGLTLARMQASPDGIDMGALTPRLPALLRTPSGKIELAPPYITRDVERLRGTLDRQDDALLLISRRHLRSNNSWMHNVPQLMSGRERCTLLIHPTDAARCRLVAGAAARVTSSAGSVEVPVQVSGEMMPGVVCLPHGWGHDKEGARLAVAAEHPGVCNNVLAPGDLVDVPSGTAVVNGIPVEVTPAR